ncbi:MULTISPECIES: FAD-binding and (Fe-S)-binding domain-containing protein [Halomonas]|uniref:FAD-binding and (Fe-S)-binding domain-containing protein n=1 Tax=Halomonas TaxID=2745 RepID=UPI000E5A7F5B|nr:MULTISPECIES: FAD-binding and (Fe-S)-binding domain-containing protein [Halomonas]AXY42043.1 FAD-binding oxidoreductase [Halomonas sp. JS92-SW72]
MIARLDTADASTMPGLAAPYLRFLEALRDAGFEGEIAPDYADRTVLATDNSIYQRLPQAALYPRHGEDLARIAHLAGQVEHRQVALTPRGGGTGTNGQSLTDGLVVDVSRHMNRILDIDVENRRVRVQAGVVKDQLNAALRPHGLFFAPELSTSNRATIGGMISTDASGQGSCEYGKTRNHVLELEVLLLGGERLVSRPLEEAELEALCERQDATGRAFRTAREIIDTQGELIAEKFPPLNRCLTGYDLAHLRDDQGRLDMNSLLCGSEGSLGFLDEAVLNVLPIPKHSTLVNVRYAGFMDALRDARALMSSGSSSQGRPQASPTSIETVDDKVLMLAMEDFVWDSVAAFFPAGDTPVRGINLVEFNDDDPERLAERVAAFCRHLESDASVQRLGFTLAEGRPQIQKVYAMRKRAVGLLGNARVDAKGEKRPIPFVEDTAVPPEHLADFISEFRAALDARGLAYGMFGHVDAGVLHVRPAIDMKDPAQERLIREVSDEVAELTKKYGGLLWGEHGKGVRSEYAPSFFGELYPSLQRVKAAFDPYNQLNPGKIATPLSSSTPPAPVGSPPETAGTASIPPDAAGSPPETAGKAPDTTQAETVKLVDPGLLTIDGVTTRGQLDRTIDERVWQAHAATVYCNGNGACYNYDPNDAMCPSWKATRDRVHSPKGRASLVREWLRLQGDAGVDLVEESRRKKAEGAWGFVKSFPKRTLNTLRRKREADFSHQVYDAMAGCLACKSCAGQCPIKVNVPDSRAQFLEVYHGRYLRPLRDYLVGTTEFLLPTLSRIAPAYNALIGNRLVDRLLSGPVGLVDSPQLSRASLRKTLAAWGVAEATPTSLGRLTEAQKAKSVVIVQDAFTSHFEANLVLDIVELLGRLDVRVFVAPFSPNGKPLHVQGFLGAFARTAEKQARRLRTLAEFGVPLVGIDPAMTLTYRQEYVKALGPEAVPEVLMLQEWLVTRASSLVPGGLTLEGAGIKDPGYRLLSHCTEKTNAPGSPKAWQQLFAAFGLELELVATGCCGMSGTYGHEARNRETSRTIYAQSWQPVVEENAHQGRLLATGYSCRSQVKRFSDAALPHPLQALLEVLRRAS